MAQMSLRNPLVAGVAAAIGAGVVTVAPAAHVPALPTTAAVALAGFDNPITELLATADFLQTYLTAPYYNGATSVTPGAGEANWPFAGFDQTGGDYMNYLFATQKGLGLYNNVGLIPQIVNTNQPIITQIVTNLLGYLNTTLNGLTAAGVAAAEGVWNFPEAAINSVKLLLNGQVQAAIKELVSAVTQPVSEILSAAGYIVRTVVSDVFTHLAAVVKVIPTNLTLFGGWLLGGSQYLVKQAVGLGTEWVQELTSGNFQNAWNVAIDGLLGPAGLPGAAFNVSLGAGVQTGPILSPADIKTNFVPSLRTAIQATLWNTQEALTTEPAGSAASAPAAAAAEAPAEAPADVPAEAPAEVPAAAEDSTPAEQDAAPADLGSTHRTRLGERVAAFKAHVAAATNAPAKAHRAARAERAAARN